MTHRHVVALVAVAVVGQHVGAQLPNASAAAFGAAGNYTAAARGYDAVAWNPANLGLGTPAFSLSILSAGGSTGLDPVRLRDVSPFQGRLLPSATKEAWLRAIGSGTERGSVDGGISFVALSAGRLGFELGVSGTGRASLNQDAAEAILFGNSGRTGEAKDLSFNNSNASGSAFATGAVSLGIPLAHRRDGAGFAAGITAKYIRGLVTGRAMDNGSSIASGVVNVQFPVIYTDTASLGNAGSGFGLDVGLAWSNSTTTVSATARNIVNTFAWSTPALRSRGGGFTFDGESSTSAFDEASYASAPAALRSAVEAERFRPEIALGVSRRLSSLTVTADAGTRVGDGIETGPKTHAGVGAEFTALRFAVLRGGASIVPGGYQVAGGVGLHLGRVDLGAGLSSRIRGGGREAGAMISLMSIR